MRVLLPLALILHLGVSHADAPLPPPSQVTACNLAKTFCATSDPVSKTLVVRDQSTGQALWSIDECARFFSLSPTGEALVVYTDFGTLAPLDATPATELFSLYRTGTRIAVVHLGALYGSVSELARTSSHLTWGSLYQLAAESVTFKLVNGSLVSFSLLTGAKVAVHEK